MSKAVVKRIYKAKLAHNSRAWKGFNEAIRDLLPDAKRWDIRNALGTEDRVRTKFSNLNEADQNKCKAESEAFETALLTELELSSEAWETWFTASNKCEFLDPARPDVSYWPHDTPVPPGYPEIALEKLAALDYTPEHWGYIRARFAVAVALAGARNRLEQGWLKL